MLLHNNCTSCINIAHKLHIESVQKDRKYDGLMDIYRKYFGHKRNEMGIKGAPKGHNNLSGKNKGSENK